MSQVVLIGLRAPSRRACEAAGASTPSFYPLVRSLLDWEKLNTGGFGKIGAKFGANNRDEHHSGSSAILRSQKNPKQKNRTNSAKELSEQFEGVTGHYPLPFVRTHSGNNSKIVFLCNCICDEIENNSEIISICYAAPSKLQRAAVSASATKN